MSTTERSFTPLPEGHLDVIIRQYGRQTYSYEALAMAQELKELRARFNRKEDLKLDIIGEGDLSPEYAAQWANMTRARMHAMALGDVLKIPGWQRQWQIVRVL